MTSARALRSRVSNKRSLSGVCWVFSAFMWYPISASAKQTLEVSHSYDLTWSGVVRFLRVDLSLPIKDRDPEAGYVIFDYRTEDGKVSTGSIELIRGVSNRIKVVVSIASVPSYVERMFLDKLKRKLNEELGATPPKPVPDAGTVASPKT